MLQADFVDHQSEISTEASTDAFNGASTEATSGSVSAQLIETEKMASLGKLLTGVAHEIHNPMNFIYGNLGYADRYTQDLMALLALYRKAYPEPTPEIAEQITQMDLDFVLEDLPKVQASMQMGADRLKEILQSLRLVSHSEGQGEQSTDLEACLDSTLVILNHRMKAVGDRPRIQIEKEYGQLPPVLGNTGRLNQALMNLLSNAIDAVEMRWMDGQNHEERFEPCIRIKTHWDGESSLSVTIDDNGCGMSAETQQQMLVPFFTTKAPTQGTGIGLSITQQIITLEHGGELTCRSAIGQGTTFSIRLPFSDR
jgi:signal transduction histidine kinase